MRWYFCLFAGTIRSGRPTISATRIRSLAVEPFLGGDNTKDAVSLVLAGTRANASTEGDLPLIIPSPTRLTVRVAFQTEIGNGKMVIIACISAIGIEAFKPWPSAKRLSSALIGMRLLTKGVPRTRRGEIAARKFADLHHRNFAVSIALPGKSGEKLDWLDLLRREELKRCAAVSSRPYRSSLRR